MLKGVELKTEKTTHSLYNGDVVIEFTQGAYDRYKLVQCFGAGEAKLAELNKYMLSVTTATGIIDKSGALVPWATKLDMDYIRHYLIENKKRVSFTPDELLPLIDEAATQHTKVKQEAASVGDLVHTYASDYAEAIIAGQSAPTLAADTSIQVVNGVNAFLDAVKQEKLTFIETEKIVYEPVLNYIGRFDLLAQSPDGKYILIDFKTSKGIYANYLPQLGGYALAHGQKLIDETQIWHFSKFDGTFTILKRTKWQINEDVVAFTAALDLKRYDKKITKELKENHEIN